MAVEGATISEDLEAYDVERVLAPTPRPGQVRAWTTSEPAGQSG